MHDPSTVAFEIRAPWFRRTRHNGKVIGRRFHPALVTVWHEDPETDGSDDSCDWGGRRLPPKARELAEEMAKWDTKFPYLFAQPVQRHQHGDDDGEYTIRRIGPGDCMALVLAVFETAAWRLHRRQLSASDIRRAISLGAGINDNFQTSLAARDAEGRVRTIRLIIGAYLRGHRRWWKHPRFHVHHWRIQVHPVQQFKRWAFSRCCHCGKRFGWGARGGVIGYSWHGEGPRWFRSEQGIAHAECDRAAMVALQAARSPAPPR